MLVLSALEENAPIILALTFAPELQVVTANFLVDTEDPPTKVLNQSVVSSLCSRLLSAAKQVERRR